MHKQTVRDMLMVAIAKPNRCWFHERLKDMVNFYYGNDRIETRSPGTVFSYDSESSFVLCALMERIKWKSSIDYFKREII